MRRASRRGEPLPVSFDKFTADTMHSDMRPHWSESVDWRPGRWDPMANAPTRGKIIHVRGRDAAGNILEPVHYACGGGEEQPAFDGWFKPCGSGFMECRPVEWQPLRAQP